MIPTWAKVVIALIAVVAILGVIWLVLWLMGRGGSSPPSPPSSGVIMPSQYTGTDAIVFPSPCTVDAKCAPDYTVATGVGWVIDNQSSLDAGVKVMIGQNCTTSSPNCVGAKASPGTVPAGKKMSWSDMAQPAPIAVGGILQISTSVGNKSISTPSTVDPTSQYVLITLQDNPNGGFPSYTSVLQNY